METRKLAFLITAFMALAISSLSQTPQPPKPSFEVISINRVRPTSTGGEAAALAATDTR